MKKISSKKLRSDHKIMLGVQRIRELQDELQEAAHQEFGFWLSWDDIMKLSGGMSPKELLVSKGYKRPRDSIKQALYDGLSKVFEKVTIADGYKDSIHIQIVSSKFAGKRDDERLNLIYEIIDDPSVGLSKAEETLVSLILPWTPDEMEEQQ